MDMLPTILVAMGYHVEGEKEGAWTTDAHVEFEIPITDNCEKVRVLMIPVSVYPDYQYYDVVQNGNILTTNVETGREYIFFEADVEDHMCRFTFVVPNAASPKELGESDDERRLGIMFKKVCVNKVEYK